MIKGKGLSLLRKHRKIGYKVKYLYYLIFKRERIQRKMSFGSLNPQKIIYITKPDSEDGIEGLLSLVVRASVYIRYGMQHQYEVCVDWKNYKTQYYDGINNAWNFFFEQPSTVTLEEAYKSKNVIISGWTFQDINPNALFGAELFKNRRLISECHELLTKYLKFNREVLDICNEEAKRLGINNCLGVFLRGTDYIKLKPSGEYVQPTTMQAIPVIEKMLKHHKCKSIFLVTEDGNIYTSLKDKFGESVLTASFDSFIYDYKGDTFLSRSGVLDDDKKKRGMNYLAKMVLLSKCKYLVSSITMGSMFSYGLNGGKYEDQYIFDLGLYP